MERLTEKGFNFTSDFVASNLQSWPIAQALKKLQSYEDTGLEPEEVARLRELAEANKDGRLVVLPEPRKPLVWGDDDHNSILCPYCGEDMMGKHYEERMLLQCPECGQYLDATTAVSSQQVNTSLGGEERC